MVGSNDSEGRQPLVQIDPRIKYTMSLKYQKMREWMYRDDPVLKCFISGRYSWYFYFYLSLITSEKVLFTLQFSPSYTHFC